MISADCAMKPGRPRRHSVLVTHADFRGSPMEPGICRVVNLATPGSSCAQYEYESLNADDCGDILRTSAEMTNTDTYKET